MSFLGKGILRSLLTPRPHPVPVVTELCLCWLRRGVQLSPPRSANAAGFEQGLAWSPAPQAQPRKPSPAQSHPHAAPLLLGSSCSGHDYSEAVVVSMLYRAPTEQLLRCSELPLFGRGIGEKSCGTR